MKVKNVEHFLVNPGWGKNLLFVKVTTDNGLVGWGECYTQSDRDKTVVVHIEHLATYLIGRDPFEIKYFNQIVFDDYSSRRGSMEIYSALSGIEQALWDICGKATNQPVYKLLGGPCRGKLRVYANGWYAGSTKPEDYAEKAKLTVDQGYTALKFDPIPGPFRSIISSNNMKQSIETVRQVRSAVGDDIDLLIEVHRRFSPMTAIKFANQIEEFDIFWFEEPCPPEFLDNLSEIRSSINMPVVTGEALYTKNAYPDVFSKRCADIINPDVANTGGILELKEIGAMAEANQVAMSPHNYNSTTIALASTLQAAITMPNFLITEYFLPFEKVGLDITDNPLIPKDGYITLNDSPGLGISLNEDKLKNYPYKEFKRSLPSRANEGFYGGAWPDNTGTN